MSFDIALSGIQAINQQLDTISNNIANAGTYGFKSSSTNFAALYAGTQKTGVEVGSESQSMNLGGGILNTGSNLNASINGAGFFISKDAQNQTLYSRVGIFKADQNGLIIDANGNAVQGMSVITLSDGSTKPGSVGNMKVSTTPMAAAASTKVTYIGNTSADWPVAVPAVTFDPANPASYNDLRVSTVYDSLGTAHTVNAYFTKTGADQITVNYMVDGNTDPTVNPQSAVLDFDGATGQLAAVNGSIPPAVPPAVAITISTPGGASDGTATGPAATMKVNFDYTGTTMFAGSASVATNQADGNTFGAYTGNLVLGKDGSLTAQYTNNETQIVGYVAVATFANQDALQAVSGTSWVATSGSGTPLVDVPGAGSNALLSTQTLEESNVDVTEQLVGLMTAQRNYQANSKVITTEDNTLQALMQAIQ